MGELAELPSQESAASWAQGALAAKNRLTADDAKLVEEAFEQRLLDLVTGRGHRGLGKYGKRERHCWRGGHRPTGPPCGGAGATSPTASTRACSRFPLPRRYRNKAHLRYVARQPCLLCGRKPSDPHHLRFMQPRALGRKASDEFSVPLCRIHHRLVHRVGNEAAWWKEAGIDPIAVARKLWGQTRRAEGRRDGCPSQ